MNGADVTRTIVVWFPDWPVLAHAQSEAVSAHEPIALIDHGLVFASSAAARAEGVRRSQRIRDAQARCPQLVTFDYDPALDHRVFEPIVQLIEGMMPGVQLVRPGTCVLRARGPARYYGGEEKVAQALFQALAAQQIAGLGESAGPGANAGSGESAGSGDAAGAGAASAPIAARIAIADGRFAATQAARMPGPLAIRIVAPGGSASFLAPLPIETIGDQPMATLLRRLGLTTLGDFAALDFRDVRARFGEPGVYAHTLASGADARRIAPRLPPRLREIEVLFEPPLDRVDQITFAVRVAADEFVDELTRSLLVCTGIHIELHTENGGVHERLWGHPRWFSSSDILDRIRWQVQGRTGNGNGALGSAIDRVRLVPESFDSIGNYEAGLWGSTPDDRVHHGLSRVQSLLGHEAVVTASIGGGRGLAERQKLVPWGEPRPDDRATADRPWPGSIPPPAPSTVFERPRRVRVRAADGDPVSVSERGVLQGIPALFEAAAPPSAGVAPHGPGRGGGAGGGSGSGGAKGGGPGRGDTSGGGVTGDGSPITAWAGPWPVRERWWNEAEARSFHRFQVVDAEGTAWLLALHGREWWAEARYD